MAIGTPVTFSSPTTGNQFTLRLELTEKSIDKVVNTSLVAYSLRLYSGGWNFSDYGIGHEVKLAGKVVSGAYRPDAPQYSLGTNSSLLLASGTATVPHDSDGGKRMSVAFSIDMEKASYTPGPIAVTGKTMDLTEIPRASTIGATDANIGAASMVVVSKKASSYTHSIAYKFGSLSGYVKADGSISTTEAKFSEASVAFRLPTSFYAQIPSAKSGQCTLTCKTWSGSTQIGEPQTCTFTATAAEDACKPSVTGTMVDTNAVTKALTGDENKLVRFHSNVLCTISAAAKNSAALRKKQIGSVEVTGNTRTIYGVETNGISFYATDSRGYQNSFRVELPMVAYIKLTNNASVSRDDPTSGKATLKLSGNYFSGSFGAQVNTLTAKYRIGSGSFVAATPTVKGNTYSLSVPLTGLDYRQSHQIEVVVSDKLASVTKTVTVKRGIPVFDWGESDFAFHVPASAPLPAGADDLLNLAYLRRRMQCGWFDPGMIPPNQYVDYKLTFPHSFPKNPRVVASIYANTVSLNYHYLTIVVQIQSPTGCTIRILNAHPSSTFQPTINWIAMTEE